MGKYLVTGAAGFIGSHLVDRLVKDGHQVYGVDNLSNGQFANMKDAFSCGNFVFLEDDFVNCLDQVDEVDAVFHLAAVGSVPRSIETPEVTFNNNVEKFHELLCFMRYSKCKRLIYASSSSVLGGGSSQPNPLSPYALSKWMNELYADQYSKHFGINSTGLRFFNVYGPRQRHDSPYAAVIPRLINDENIKLHAPGTQSRDFTYVKDVVDALVSVQGMKGFQKSCGKVYNVGCGDSRNLFEVVETLRRLLPERKWDVEIIDPRPGDVLFSCCDNRALIEDTGWRPKFSLEEGLKDMIYGEG